MPSLDPLYLFSLCPKLSMDQTGISYPNNNSLPHNTLMFQSLRRYSTEFLSFVTIPPHNALLNIPAAELISTTTSPPCLLSIIHQFHNTTSQIHCFFSTLREHLLNALKEEQVDAATKLDTLNNLMVTVSRFTDESLDSIAVNACATLRELDLLAQDFEKKLDKAKASARVFNVFFTIFAVGVAAVVSPVVSIDVGPLLQSFEQLCNDVMEKPIKENQKVIEIISFMIHSTIVKVGRINDIVEHLNMLVVEPKHVGDVETLIEVGAPAVAMVGTCAAWRKDKQVEEIEVIKGMKIGFDKSSNPCALKKKQGMEGY